MTHFNRGLTEARTRASVEAIRGDRATDIHILENRHWDAVIDMCGFTPDVVETSTRYLADRVGRYVFFSTISVYDHEQTQHPNEDAPLLRLPEGADRTVFALEHYGALKALCEAVVTSTFRHRATVLRPALIAGPYDPTDRFTYWPLRVDAGGLVLAPLRTHRIQYIDARDLAVFAVRVVERGIGGAYNCATASDGTTFGELLDACEKAARSRVDIMHAPDAFLESHGIEPWADLPLWIPNSSEYAALVNCDTTRAGIQGFITRAPFETVRDTLAWAQAAHKQLDTLKAGLAPEREREAASSLKLL